MPGIEGGRNTGEQAARFKVGENKTLPNGAQVKIESKEKPHVYDALIDPNGPGPSRSASRAEALHVVVGEKVKPGNIIGAKLTQSGGETKVKEYDETTAGVHIDEGGGGIDAAIIRANRGDVRSAVSRANQIKSNTKPHTLAVARYLDQHNEIDGDTARDVIKFVDKKIDNAKNPPRAEATVFKPDGQKVVTEVQIYSDKSVELPRAMLGGREMIAEESATNKPPANDNEMKPNQWYDPAGNKPEVKAENIQTSDSIDTSASQLDNAA